MPQVPYRPYPQVSVPTPGEQIHVETPGAAFGENIARSVEGLGGSMEKAGGEIFQRAVAIQDLANETEAREADAKYAIEQGQLHADYIINNQGANARAALPKFLADSNSMRQRYRDNLSNPAAQRLFDASSLGFMIRNVNSASLHAGSEMEKYAFGTADATVKRAASEYVDPDNPEEVAANRDKARAAIRTQAGIKGWSKPETDLALEQFDNHQLAGQITAIANKGDVPRAWEMYQQAIADKTLEKDTAEKVRQHLWNENEKRAAKVYVDKIVSPEKTDADMQREMEQLVNDPKINLGDPLFGQFMRNTLDHRLYEMQKGARLAKSNDLNVIYGLINKGASDYASIAAVPEGQAALESLERNNPKAFLDLKKNIPVYAGRRDFETHERSMNILQNLARNDPNKFLEVDLFDKDLHLTRQDRDHWINERDRILKNGGTSVRDPIVNQGINYIEHNFGSQMRALGLVSSTGKRQYGDDWDSFWGYVDTSIRKFQQDNKRQPTNKELDEIGKQAFVQHAEPWLGQMAWPAQVPEYRRTQTKEDVETARKELRKANEGVEPDDLQIRRWLIQNQWNKIHQGGAKKEEVTSGGPKPPTVPRSE